MMGMPSCREVARRLSREQDGAAVAPRSLGLRVHLLICRNCRRYARQLDRLRVQLRRLAAQNRDARLSADARARIRERLRSEYGPKA